MNIILAGSLVKICRETVILSKDLYAKEGDEILVMTDTIVPFYPKERYELCEFVGIFDGKISIMRMYRHEFKIFGEF